MDHDIGNFFTLCFHKLFMKEFQKLMADIYLEKDKVRGLEKTVLWLVSEIGELSELIAKNGTIEKDSQVKENITLELADCFAWLFSVANLLDIDVEESFLKKYPHKCPRCHAVPCQCVENN